MDHEDLAGWIERYERAWRTPGTAPVRVYRDLWVVTLDRDGLCIAFEEWPFFPGRPRTPRDAEAQDRINR
jgi:hypothetical protein